MIFCGSYLLSQLSMIKVTVLYYLYCGMSASNEYFGSSPKLTLSFFFFLITKVNVSFLLQIVIGVTLVYYFKKVIFAFIF